MNTLSKSLISYTLLMLTTALVQAGLPVFSVLPTIKPPLKLPVNSVATAQYQVINNSCTTHTITMRPIIGVTQITTGTGVCPYSFTLAKGKSCLLTLRLNGRQIGRGLYSGPQVCATISPENNNPSDFLCANPSREDSFNVSVIDMLTATLTVNNLNFNQPQVQDLVLSNQSTDTSLNVNGLTLTNSTLTGVTIAPLPQACQTLMPGSSCQWPITIDDNGSGRAIARISYSSANQVFQADGGIAVANTTVNVSSSALVNNAIRLPPASGAPITVTFTNNGTFNWQNAQAIFAGIPNVTFNSNCTTDIAIGANCTATLQSNNATIGASAILSATGDNLTTVNTQVIIDGGVVVAADTQATNRHMAYRAIRVDNLTPQSVVFNNVAIGVALQGLVTYCQTGDLNCTLQSTCQNNQPIASAGNCLVWLKAEESNSEQVTQGTVTVTANGTAYPLTVDYSMSLIAGGSFTNAGGGSVNYIARWNGTGWSTYGNGMNNNINTFTLDANQDLVAGGAFTTAGGNAASYIARWDGNDWNSYSTGLPTEVFATILDGSLNLVAAGSGGFISSWNGSIWTLIGGATNSTVRALALDINQNLVAGGFFTTAGGNPADHIAFWNGTNWNPYGSGMTGDYVLALLLDDNQDLVAGGNFTAADGVPANKIASFDGSTWSAYSSGMNGSYILALTLDENQDVVAGGNFSTAGGNSANNIARWDGANWNTYGSGMNNIVTALTLDSNQNLVAGGSFTSAGGVAANRIARWDGSNWNAYASGIGNGEVYALIRAPALLIQ